MCKWHYTKEQNAIITPGELTEYMALIFKKRMDFTYTKRVINVPKRTDSRHFHDVSIVGADYRASSALVIDWRCLYTVM